ncbi:helix-turn-helix transcriptional regulator [Vibrio fluvialis]|uniref:helix-turn-helix domain-containing protein n=1 Tax=Vibrio fluvialis TaxID=676 RepID=UPI00192C3E0A|nr:helix-turn-helix transcriptional regulator [Vibrio fluvialis]EKO3933819.1 helix-turn-helix transcriptional regulator [Vibrio fluvialis]MBL4295702.1 helix-turn-helix transcriptional regulator [Vibrio fluvialis]
MEYVNMSIGEVLKERRIELGIKQEDLAEQMDVTVQTVSKWERGITEPKASQVAKMAEILKLTEREICQGKKDPIGDMDPFAFMKMVGPLMNDVSETEVIMSIYEYLSDKEGFIESLAEQAQRPYAPVKEREREQAKEMLRLYEDGAITFNNDEEKARCLAAWNNALGK